MTDAQRELERAAQQLADGQALDWEGLARGGVLTAREIAGLRLLAGLRGESREAQVLEEGFDVFELLGRGSMGHVHRAFDRALRREVALKIVAPERGLSPSSRANFVAEARLLASIRHPGVVQVYSIHEHEGRIRMALERIDGLDLDQVVKSSGTLSCAEAARVGGELCRALASLHERGITHRDLKPSNVMREKGGRIVLLDFGIARSPHSPSPRTANGAGTPRFMAPEQFNGEEPGPQADVWALGALLYWLVSARFPFEGETYEELRRSVLGGRFVPLVDRRPDADPRFAALLERALRRDLRERHASIGEVEQELRALLADAPGPPPAVPGALPAPRPPRGARRAGTWLAAAGVVAAAVLWGWSSLPGQARPLQIEAQFYALRAGQEVRLGNGDPVAVGDELQLEFTASEPAHLYVLDQDDTGEPHVLFPVPGFEPQNPLPAGAVHRLPGRQGSEVHSWEVTSSGGGGETITLIASRAPLEALRQVLATIPPVRPGEAPVHPELSAPTRTALLRGIGGTKVADPAPAERRDRAGDALDLGRVLETLALPPEIAVRVLRLRNP